MDGKKYKYTIHRLVALHFVPNPDNLPIVLHKDNVKMNTYYQNLKWGTYSENNAQAIRDGLNVVPKPDNRKYYRIYNNRNNIICHSIHNICETIGYGTDSCARNYIFRETPITQGEYKGYYLRKVKNKAIHFNPIYFD